MSASRLRSSSLESLGRRSASVAGSATFVHGSAGSAIAASQPATVRRRLVGALQIEASGRSGGQLTAKLKGGERSRPGGSLAWCADWCAASGTAAARRQGFLSSRPHRLRGGEPRGSVLGQGTALCRNAGSVLMVVRGRCSGARRDGIVRREGIAGEQEYWVPAVPLHLRRVDLTARRVVVDWDDAAG